MYELRKIAYLDPDGNEIGSDIQYRTRTLSLSLGVLVFGAWSTWVTIPVVDVSV